MLKSIEEQMYSERESKYSLKDLPITDGYIQFKLEADRKESLLDDKSFIPFIYQERNNSKASCFMIFEVFERTVLSYDNLSVHFALVNILIEPR